MSRKSITRTIAIASATGVLTLALTGLAVAATDDGPEEPGCTALTAAYLAAQVEARAVGSPGQRRNGTVVTDEEQAKIAAAVNAAKTSEKDKAENPASPEGEEITPAEQAAINDAGSNAYNTEYAKATSPDSDGPLVQDGTVITAEEQAEINAKRDAADETCTGAAGPQGQPGAQGATGPQGQPGAQRATGPNGTTVEHNTQNNYYDGTPQAPVPTIVTEADGYTLPAVTH